MLLHILIFLKQLNNIRDNALNNRTQIESFLKYQLKINYNEFVKKSKI